MALKKTPSMVQVNTLNNTHHDTLNCGYCLKQGKERLKNACFTAGPYYPLAVIVPRPSRILRDGVLSQALPVALKLKGELTMAASYGSIVVSNSES
jgi:hypothetical protein